MSDCVSYYFIYESFYSYWCFWKNIALFYHFYKSNPGSKDPRIDMDLTLIRSDTFALYQCLIDVDLKVFITWYVAKSRGTWEIQLIFIVTVRGGQTDPGNDCPVATPEPPAPPCGGIYCFNGATKLELSETECFCSCPLGWQGDFCECE